MIAFDTYINAQFEQAKYNMSHFIEMLYLNAKSKLEYIQLNRDSPIRIIKVIDDKILAKYLRRRGYVENYVSGRLIYTKDFTCVHIEKEHIEVWHDIKNSKPVFVSSSLLTGLPITLDYMERI